MSSARIQADLFLRIQSFRPPQGEVKWERVCFVLINTELLSEQQRHEAWRAVQARNSHQESLNYQVAFVVSDIDASILAFVREIYQAVKLDQDFKVLTPFLSTETSCVGSRVAKLLLGRYTTPRMLELIALRYGTSEHPEVNEELLQFLGSLPFVKMSSSDSSTLSKLLTFRVAEWEKLCERFAGKKKVTALTALSVLKNGVTRLDFLEIVSCILFLVARSPSHSKEAVPFSEFVRICQPVQWMCMQQRIAFWLFGYILPFVQEKCIKSDVKWNHLGNFVSVLANLVPNDLVLSEALFSWRTGTTQEDQQAVVSLSETCRLDTSEVLGGELDWMALPSVTSLSEVVNMCFLYRNPVKMLLSLPSDLMAIALKQLIVGNVGNCLENLPPQLADHFLESVQYATHSDQLKRTPQVVFLRWILVRLQQITEPRDEGLMNTTAHHLLQVEEPSEDEIHLLFLSRRIPLLEGMNSRLWNLFFSARSAEFEGRNIEPRIWKFHPEVCWALRKPIQVSPDHPLCPLSPDSVVGQILKSCGHSVMGSSLEGSFGDSLLSQFIQQEEPCSDPFPLHRCSMEKGESQFSAKAASS